MTPSRTAVCYRDLVKKELFESGLYSWNKIRLWVSLLKLSKFQESCEPCILQSTKTKGNKAAKIKENKVHSSFFIIFPENLRWVGHYVGRLGKNTWIKTTPSDHRLHQISFWSYFQYFTRSEGVINLNQCNKNILVTAVMILRLFIRVNMFKF